MVTIFVIETIWVTPKEKACKSMTYRLIRDPGRIRTPNPQSRNLIFYPVELRGQRGGEITMQNAIPATFLCALLFRGEG